MRLVIEIGRLNFVMALGLEEPEDEEEEIVELPFGFSTEIAED